MFYKPQGTSESSVPSINLNLPSHLKFLSAKLPAFPVINSLRDNLLDNHDV